MDVFWQNMGMRAVIFLWEIGQKASYWLLWPIMAIIDCSFERIDVFFTNHVHESRGLFMKILKKRTWRHRVLRDWTFFWTKYGYESYMFFREWTKIWAREQWFFREKSWRVLYWLFWPIIYRSFDRIGVLALLWAHGVFHEKVEKNGMRAQCFLKNVRFLTKYGHESYVFF